MATLGTSNPFGRRTLSVRPLQRPSPSAATRSHPPELGQQHTASGATLDPEEVSQLATNKGKNPALTFPQMVEAEQGQKRASKLYKAEASEFVDDRLSALISKTTAELVDAATSKRITMSDIDSVKERTVIYLRACEESATFPSITGLARALGVTRRCVYDVIERKSPAPAAEWLELCRDTFSDILAESSLRGNSNTIASIFIQKALYGLRESIEIIPGRQESVYGEQKSAEQIAAEYDALPEA